MSYRKSLGNGEGEPEKGAIIEGEMVGRQTMLSFRFNYLYRFVGYLDLENFEFLKVEVVPFISVYLGINRKLYRKYGDVLPFSDLNRFAVFRPFQNGINPPFIPLCST